MNAPIPTEAAGKPLADAEIRLIIIGVLMAMFLGALDQTIVATALPTMGRELGSFELLPWIVTSYLVTSTAITPLYGKVSDIVAAARRFWSESEFSFSGRSRARFPRR